jgi:hypothetical protein
VHHFNRAGGWAGRRIANANQAWVDEVESAPPWSVTGGYMSVFEDSTTITTTACSIISRSWGHAALFVRLPPQGGAYSPSSAVELALTTTFAALALGRFNCRPRPGAC